MTTVAISDNSSSLQESWHLPPSSLSLARQTLESLARETTPPLLSVFYSPSLSFSPFSHFTHLKPDGLLAEMESPSLPDAKPSNVNPKRRSVWTPAYVSTPSKGVPVAESLLEEAKAIGSSRKNDRDRSTLITSNSIHVHSSVWSIPGKILIPTNQIRA